MSNDKADLQTVAPDFARFGFTNKEALEKFLRSDEGKLVQSHQMAVYMEKKHQEEILADYFTRQEEIRRAVIAAILMEEELDEEERAKKQSEAAVQPPTTPTTPKDQQPQTHDEKKADYQSQLDKVNEKIINTAQKYDKYDDIAENAQQEANVIDGKDNEKAIRLLDYKLTALDKRQNQLLLDMMASSDDQEIMKLQVEYNNNAVRMGVLQDLKAVRTGQKDIYDKEGNKITITDDDKNIIPGKFKDAYFIVPKDKEIINHNGKMYLINTSDVEKLPPNATAAEKVEFLEKQVNDKTGKSKAEEALTAFKKAEPEMSNVRDFLKSNRKLEMGDLFKQQVHLQNKLGQVMALNQGLTATTTATISPQQLGSPANTQVAAFNQSSLPVGTQPLSPPTTTTPTSPGPKTTKPSESHDTEHHTAKKN